MCDLFIFMIITYFDTCIVKYFRAYKDYYIDREPNLGVVVLYIYNNATIT